MKYNPGAKINENTLAAGLVRPLCFHTHMTKSVVQLLFTEIDSPLSPGQWNMLRVILPSDMLARSERFRRWRDRQAYLLGKFLTIEGLRRYGFDVDIIRQLQHTEYGRPYIPDAPDFNISRSGHLVVCAISDQFRVGVDVENIQPIEISDFTEQFTATELRIMKASPCPHAEFFRCWTIKEAVIKADGRGLQLALKEIPTHYTPFSIGEFNWHTYRVNIENDRYAVHLVASGLLREEIVPEKILLVDV
jgi:4'-phosphopantetheinyl transferase